CAPTTPNREDKFTFAKQLLKGVPGQGATDLQPLRHNCRGDELMSERKEVHPCESPLDNPYMRK
ncbi:hypothetical protein FQN60_004732, partial [Etheostoma spectabile]